jgi:hypothetical protein
MNLLITRTSYVQTGSISSRVKPPRNKCLRTDVVMRTTNLRSICICSRLRRSSSDPFNKFSSSLSRSFSANPPDNTLLRTTSNVHLSSSPSNKCKKNPRSRRQIKIMISYPTLPIHVKVNCRAKPKSIFNTLIS